MIKGIYNYIGAYSKSVYGTYILALLIFIEGFFVVPVSTILAFYCIENRKKAILYATIVTIASTFGSFVGYNIGYWLYTNGGDKLIYYFVSQENFQKLVEYYKKYELLTIGLISLTPIPFKALTISAGFCQLPLLQFIIYSTISRGIKFYTIAISIYFLGDKIKYYLDRYFYYILTIFILSFIIIFKILH